MNTPHRIMFGAGFGGLNAARQLRDAPVQITLIDRQKSYLSQPLQKSKDINILASPYRPPAVRTGACR